MIKKIIGFIIVALIVPGCDNKKDQAVKLSQKEMDSLQVLRCDSLIADLVKIKADTFGSITSVPVDFEGCLLQLDSITSAPMKEWIKCLPDKEFGRSVHHGYGMYLRNSWGLWEGSELSQNLHKMGMLHPDDMTAILFDSYQRRLKGEDMRLDEQLKYYQDYWRKNGTPVDSILQSIGKK